jgi:translation initiation factor 3 subunit L
MIIIRNIMRYDDVAVCYDQKFKELSDTFFTYTPWPDSRYVSSEWGKDDDFALFYKEMTLRHLSTKLKPTLNDHIESWHNYLKLFEFITSTSKYTQPEICLTVQWIQDIMHEFVYQFQGFCQFRTKVTNISADDINVLEANADVWTFPKIQSILKKLIAVSGIKKADPESTTQILHQRFGIFAAIELSRLECLVGDYDASIKALAPIFAADRSEIFSQSPSTHVNLYYHAGVSFLMLRRYADALETFAEIILHFARILKPGFSADSNQKMLLKMLDKTLSLAAVTSALCPGKRVDDQVREMMETRAAEKVRRLSSGDILALRDIFAQAAPQFISPLIPDYSEMVNLNYEAINTQVSIFATEAQQQLSVLSIRSFLRLYTSIELSKLARFNEVSDSDLMSQLMAFKHKTVQVQSNSTAAGLTSASCLGGERVSTSDVNYYIQDNAVILDSTNSKSEKSRTIERFLTGGIRKHSEIQSDLIRFFNRINMNNL